MDTIRDIRMASQIHYDHHSGRLLAGVGISRMSATAPLHPVGNETAIRSGGPLANTSGFGPTIVGQTRADWKGPKVPRAVSSPGWRNYFPRRSFRC